MPWFEHAHTGHTCEMPDICMVQLDHNRLELINGIQWMNETCLYDKHSGTMMHWDTVANIDKEELQSLLNRMCLQSKDEKK